MSAERWLPIVGYEGHYEVSDHGRVRSLTRAIPGNRPGSVSHRSGQIRKLKAQKRGGHLVVALHSSGRRRDILVHRLVLEAFVGKCPEGLEGLHWDDDPTNNHLTNLRWETRRVNQLDAVRNGRHGNTRKTQCPQKHPYDLTLRRSNGTTYRACSKCRRAIRARSEAKTRKAAA